MQRAQSGMLCFSVVGCLRKPRVGGSRAGSSLWPHSPHLQGFPNFWDQGCDCEQPELARVSTPTLITHTHKSKYHLRVFWLMHNNNINIKKNSTLTRLWARRSGFWTRLWTNEPQVCEVQFLYVNSRRWTTHLSLTLSSFTLMKHCFFKYWSCSNCTH